MITEANEAVLQALAAGKTTVQDAATGFQHPIYGRCPHDAEATTIRRVVRGPNGAITAVSMVCLRCGHDFSPPLTSLFIQ